MIILPETFEEIKAGLSQPAVFEIRRWDNFGYEGSFEYHGPYDEAEHALTLFVSAIEDNGWWISPPILKNAWHRKYLASASFGEVKRFVEATVRREGFS